MFPFSLCFSYPFLYPFSLGPFVECSRSGEGRHLCIVLDLFTFNHDTYCRFFHRCSLSTKFSSILSSLKKLTLEREGGKVREREKHKFVISLIYAFIG